MVRDYAAAMPPGYVFSIKVNSITLTHHYRSNKNASLVPNPYFLSIGLMERFIRAIEPLAGHIGPLMFQFEYLNRQKMAGLHHFLELFSTFRRGLPGGYRYCIETRDPNWLRGEYFDFLAGDGLGHLFLQGYYMPPMAGVYWQVLEKLVDPVVIRLHGGGCEEIEKLTGNAWNRVVAPKDGELVEMVKMVRDQQRRRHDFFINVDTLYEGSALLTIATIYAALDRQKGEWQTGAFFRYNR